MDNTNDHESMYVPPIAQEFSGARFHDRRLTARLMRVVERAAPSPGKSIPQWAQGGAELDGVYRFLSNPRVTLDRILEPHVLQTVERCAQVDLVIVAHDTTECEFTGLVRRKGLGPLRSQKTQGFLAHVSLAISGDESRRPLGVLGVHTWTRSELGRSKKDGRNRSGAEYTQLEERESKRWAKQIDRTSSVVGECASLLHVMDREADAYSLLTHLVETNKRFVVRASQLRIAREDDDAAPEHVQTIAARADGVLETEVPIASRAASPMPNQSKTFVPRESRRVKLRFSATTVQIHRPRYMQGADWLKLNVVRVFEIDPPAGVAPIAWLLYTTEPIDTVAQVEAIVGYYRARWLIEEFFKALKTGCELEERQLESYAALRNAFALFLPIAWQMLLLRNVSRSSPHAPATTVLSAEQIEVLRVFAPKKLPPQPTARDVLLAVALLGGYVPNKRDPGWLVLGRGMDKLLTLVLGWSANGRSPRCAES